MSTQSEHSYEFGDFRLEPSERQLLRNGSVVPLTPKAFETLLLLVRKGGRLVEKEELLKEIWSEAFVEEANLARNIWMLRKALGDDNGKHRYIETVPKRGYRFIAEVTEKSNDTVGLLVQRRVRTRIVTEEEDTPHEPTALNTDKPVIDIEQNDLVKPVAAFMTPASPAALETRHPKQTITPNTTRRSKTAILVILAVAGLIGIVITVLVMRSRARTMSGPTTISSIAVLPFLNAGGDPELDYLSDGVTEDIINRLSPASNFKIIALNSVLHYKGKDIDAQKVAKALGVQAILVGRVVERGDRLSVSAELIDGRDNSHIWGESYDRKTDDLRFLQEELARDITNSLRLQFTNADQRVAHKGYAENSEAQQSYLKGRYFWNKRTEADLQRGIEHFQKAIERDPNYALAYAGLADSYIMLANWDFAPPAEAYAKARAAAIKALDLDSQLAEAQTSLAYTTLLYEWDWKGAEKRFKEAIKLSPNYASAHHFYSICLMTQGRQDEALAEIQRAQELDPLSLIITSVHGWIHYEGRQFDQAIVYYTRTLEMDSHYVPALLDLGTTFMRRGEQEKAIAEFEKARATSGDTPAILSNLAQAYALSGRRAEALRLVSQLEQRSSSRFVSPWNLARIYVSLDDNERAIRLLERAAEQKVGWVILLGVDPAFDRLRDDPKFVQLIDRIGIPHGSTRPS
jgi:TolB-like protein/DNA-binding winged helix-turn-helix (wHTH) protein/Tfp pilus assembly protein PilF